MAYTTVWESLRVINIILNITHHYRNFSAIVTCRHASCIVTIPLRSIQKSSHVQVTTRDVTSNIIWLTAIKETCKVVTTNLLLSILTQQKLYYVDPPHTKHKHTHTHTHIIYYIYIIMHMQR